MSEDYDVDATFRLRDESLKLAHLKIEELEKVSNSFRNQARDMADAVEHGQTVISKLRSELAQAEYLGKITPKFDLYTFIAENVARCEAKHGFDHKVEDWSLSDWMTALIGELGEAANIIKKMNRNRDKIRNPKGESLFNLHSELRLEIADAFIYLTLLSHAAGIDLPAAVRLKFDATSELIGYTRKPGIWDGAHGHEVVGVDLAAPGSDRTAYSTVTDGKVHDRLTPEEEKELADYVESNINRWPLGGRRSDAGQDIKMKHTGINTAPGTGPAMATVPAKLIHALREWMYECGTEKAGKFEPEELYRQAKAFFFK